MYTGPGCTGTPYGHMDVSTQAAVKSSNPSESGVYEFGQARRPRRAVRVEPRVHGLWGPRAPTAPYHTSGVAPLSQISGSDLPPALNGPLRFVPAGLAWAFLANDVRLGFRRGGRTCRCTLTGSGPVGAAPPGCPRSFI